MTRLDPGQILRLKALPVDERRDELAAIRAETARGLAELHPPANDPNPSPPARLPESGRRR